MKYMILLYSEQGSASDSDRKGIPAGWWGTVEIRPVIEVPVLPKI